MRANKSSKVVGLPSGKLALNNSLISPYILKISPSLSLILGGVFFSTADPIIEVRPSTRPSLSSLNYSFESISMVALLRILIREAELFIASYFYFFCIAL
jgi:hypothetical protein